MKYLTCDQDIPARLRRLAQDDTQVKVLRLFEKQALDPRPLWMQLLGPTPAKYQVNLNWFREQEEAYQRMAPHLRTLMSGWKDEPENTKKPEMIIIDDTEYPEQVQEHPEDFQL